MARITILIALLAALALVVHTSASRSEYSCKRVNLRRCEKLMTQRVQQQQEEEEDHLRRIKHVFLRSRGGEESQEQEELLEQCCEPLNKLKNERCQCRALQHIYENQSEELEGRKQKEQLEEELEKLPSICGFGPLQDECELNREQD